MATEVRVLIIISDKSLDKVPIPQLGVIKACEVNKSLGIFLASKLAISEDNFWKREDSVSLRIASAVGTMPHASIPPLFRKLVTSLGYNERLSAYEYASKFIISAPVSVSIDQSVFPQQCMPLKAPFACIVSITEFNINIISCLSMLTKLEPKFARYGSSINMTTFLEMFCNLSIWSADFISKSFTRASFKVSLYTIDLLFSSTMLSPKLTGPVTWPLTYSVLTDFPLSRNA